MNPLMRDVLICLGVALILQLVLLGPLLAALLLTGGAPIVITLLIGVVGGGAAFDYFGIRPGGTRGWPLTAAGAGFVVNIAFNAYGATAGGVGP